MLTPAINCSFHQIVSQITVFFTLLGIYRRVTRTEKLLDSPFLTPLDFAAVILMKAYGEGCVNKDIVKKCEQIKRD